MRTSTSVPAGLRAGLGLAFGGCLLASVSACGGGSVAGASLASPTARPAPAAAAMAPAVEPTGTALPGPADVTIGAGQNGGHVPLTLGRSLMVTLPGNPATGYVWELTQVDTNVLRRDGEVSYTPSAPQVASPSPDPGGTFTARFTAMRPGETWLKLIYRRPFEQSTGKNRPRTFAAHIVVTAAAP